MSKSVIILICAVLCALSNGAAQVDSLFYITGGRGMVPCKDGSFIGGMVSCRGPMLNLISDWCPKPVLTRSWDGGKTWTPENVDIPDHSPSGVVRLRNGDLLTSYNRWDDGFLRSSDNGLTWSVDTDTTQLLQGGWSSLDLIRDFRGMLYWRSGSVLLSSIDEGKHVVAVRGASTRQGFYVLPPNGTLVTYLLGSYSFSYGNVDISYDHGRSWDMSLHGYERNDSSLIVDRLGVVRDTLVVGVRLFRKNLDLSKQTWYHQEQTRNWLPGISLGYDYEVEILLDSAGAIWSRPGMIGVLRPGDSLTRFLYGTYGTDSLKHIPWGSDSTMLFGYTGVYGFFYDLDGNVHAHGLPYLFPTDKPRPVSRLDRLYTCNGVQYVVGGRAISNVQIDAARSLNAELSFSVTPNNRLVTIDVVAIDSLQPMYVAMTVDDSVLGRQWFYDSVGVGIPNPSVMVTQKGSISNLNCTWPDGPFMWYKDGEPLKHTGIGYNGEANVLRATPGTYKVRGRTRYGCVVESNDVVVATTGVDESVDAKQGYRVWYRGETGIEVEWDPSLPSPSSITVTDAIGREIANRTGLHDGRETIFIGDTIGVAFVTLEFAEGTRTYGVLCLP